MSETGIRLSPMLAGSLGCMRKAQYKCGECRWLQRGYRNAADGPITDGDGIGEGVVFICGKHGGNIFRCVLPRVGKWQTVPQIVEIFSLSSAAARSFASDSCHFLKILQVHAFAKGPSDAQIKWSYCSIYRISVIVIVETISAVSFSLCFRGLQIGNQMPHS